MTMPLPDPHPQLAGPWVDVRSFAPSAHPRDGKAPWDTYIQDAVDYLVYNTIDIPPCSAGTLYFPPGRYLINNPIRIRRLHPPPEAKSDASVEPTYAQCAIRITGDAPSYGANNFHGSALIAGFTDKPAIIIQHARAVQIENLAIMGKNNWKDVYDVSHISVLYDDANFLAPGITDDKAHAPYAGICIDPFAVTSTSPPQLPSEVYPGLEAEYLPSQGSVHISIARCFIYGFVVGIVISPNGITQNADNIFIDDCIISSTKSAIAVCQDQSRCVSCRNLNVTYTKYVIDCTHYGKKTGCCPSLFTANIGWTKYIFNTYSFGSGAAFDGVYAEATLSLGVLGGGGTSDGYAFNGCAFNLLYAADRPSVGYHLANLARATFNACQVSLYSLDREEAAPLWIYSAGMLSFHDCLLGIVNFPYNSPSFWILGVPQRTSFSNTMVVYEPEGAIFSDVRPVYTYYDILNQAVLPGCMLHPLVEPNPDNSPRWVASGLRNIPLAGATNLSLHEANGTVTFQPATPGVVAPGDLVTLNNKVYTDVIESFKGPFGPAVLGKVTSIDPQTGLVTLSHVPEYVFAQLPTKPPDPMTKPSLAVVGFYKIHANVPGHVTSGDDTHITFPYPIHIRTWVVGDRIRAKEGFVRPNTYVAAVQTTGQPPALLGLTLSQPMTGAPADGTLTLYDADVRIFTSTQVY
jgi:hypothetical protein